MTEYIHLKTLRMFERVEIVKGLQKGTPVQAFSFEWKHGTLDSTGRYMGSDVAYINHYDENQVMYFVDQLKIPVEYYLKL